MTTVNADELHQHVARMRRQRSDDASVEAKAAVRDLPKSIWDTVSAFANTDGGTIILGLDEREDFQPAKGFTEAVAKRRIDALISGLDASPQGSAKVAPVPDCVPERDTVDGRPVVVLNVPSLRERLDIDMPCYVIVKGILNGSFKRMDDHDVRLSPYEVHVLRTRRIEDPTDREPVLGTTIEDLNPQSVDRLLSELRSSSSHILDHINKDDRETALKRLNILTSDGVPTFAGYATLAPYPQQEFPRLVVDVAVHPGTQKAQDTSVRFLDRQVCDGPIPLMVEDAVSAVTRNLRHRRITKGALAEDILEIPEDVLREAITNAVMHRDYSAHAQGQTVAVDIYQDRVEVGNPGGLYGGRTITNIDEGLPVSRNKVLANLLRSVPRPHSRGMVAEAAGTGVPRMINAMRQQGLPAPDYDATTIDRVTVKLSRFGLLDPDVRAWLDSLPGGPGNTAADSVLALTRRDGKVWVVDIRRNLGLDSDDVRDLLGELVAEGLLIGMNDGPYVLADPKLGMPSTGARWEVLSVLDSREPLKIQEIAEQTGKSLSALRPLLRELVGDGLITATAPPTSRNRAYLLAE